MSGPVVRTFAFGSARALLAAAVLILATSWSTFTTRVRADPVPLPRACSASALSTSVRECADCPSTHEHCEDILPADFEPECRDLGDSESPSGALAVREVWCRTRPPKPNASSGATATTSPRDASSRGCAGHGDVALACTLGLVGLALFVRRARGARS